MESYGLDLVGPPQHKKFSAVEDNKLTMLVRQYGACNWNMISNFMTGRTSRQCRERWKYYLSMPIKNGNWTPEEDSLLIQKYKEIGPHWVEMATYFDSRTDINLKNRFNRLQRIKKRSNNPNRFFNSSGSSPESEPENVSCNSRVLLEIPFPVSSMFAISKPAIDLS